MTADRPRTVAIIGQGYVGLPAARAAVTAGHTVIGYDLDADKIAALAAGSSPIEDVSDYDLHVMLATGRYRPTDDPDALAGFDVALVTVPTPLRDGRPDLSAVEAAGRTLSRHLTRDAVIVLESTVAPGTTAGEFRAALAENPAGLDDTDGYHLGFSPERVDPGNKHWGFHNTPKLVSGTTTNALHEITAFYSTVCETVVPCPSTQVAEMAKLLENTYRHVNIALVNEMGRHAHALGISIWDVIAAAATKPYGFQPFHPGPGVGGHCLPVDPVYLSDRVEHQLRQPFDFIDLAMRINDDQPRYVVDRATALLNTRRRSVNGAEILVLGMAYKPGTGDMRESPALAIVERLRGLGASVTVCEPHTDVAPQLPAWPDVKTADVSHLAVLAFNSDLVILVTDHPEFPYEHIARGADLILDTRNRFAPHEHIHRL